MNPRNTKLNPKLFQGDLDESTFQIYEKEAVLSIDCEMMGLNPRRDRLCVIQMCDSSNNFSVVQVLPGQTEAPFLKKLFENPNITKIFHFARMDVTFLWAHLGIVTNPVFCTKIASKLARTYTDRHGLKENIREFFGENMDKKNQSSDWGKKTLSQDQIEYACDDVKFLIALKSKLTEMLIRERRYELAKKCFDFIFTYAEMDYLEMKEIFEH
ncbi:MAG: ribonuclease D [Spirochaetota bacterium]